MKQLSFNLAEPDVLPDTKLQVECDRYGLFYKVTVSDGNREAITTMDHAPGPDDPAVLKLRRRLSH